MNKLIAIAFAAAITMPLMGVAPILSSAAGFADVTEPAARYDLDGSIEIPVTAAELADCRATLEQVFVGAEGGAAGSPSVRCVVIG
ncbi:hypothetical protein CLV79_103317 [Limimaricola soesokkakensis]|uniref:UrcA family protein n=1 Tax=Limimaricola soesokkakensis TaxID=1343159 RepID=A0A1X6Y7Y6_9RHOB|nr:hypothetical protein [Limimaricola soesokkakensis]PSK87266.1 hypothetical protein CLV79_103317 [Limimaricola soesokkakensis]SLN13100.1 hypothetical protein LOS8367_00081 [Limimaricola soesokkakensis]